MKLSLSKIRADGGTQSRTQLDWIAIDEYAGAMREGAIFPAITVFYDGSDYWLADGFHRVRAAENAGLTEILADVQQGTRRDAILHSVGANAGHGIRRTNRDKRQAVMMLLNDTEWGQWSDKEIARRCAVAAITVGRIRGELIYNNVIDKPTPRKVMRNGTTYTQDASNIGKPKSEPEPAPALFATEKVQQLQPVPAPKPAPAFVGTISEPEPAPLPVVEPERKPVPVPAALPITIHNKDARFLADYVDDVHLVITSPPYNVGIDYDQHGDDISTYIPLITDVWRECYKVMAEGARIAVVVPFGVGRNPYIPFDNQIMQTLIDAGFILRGRIVWDKNTTGNRTSWGSFRMGSNPSIRDTTECIIVAHKGTGALPIPDEHKHKDGKGTYTAWLQDSDYFMELAQDHWQIAPERAQRVKHPAPFPTELVRRLVHFYGFPGCHMLDPFGGSGTVGVVAKELGCQATLFEISTDYCSLAERRINE